VPVEEVLHAADELRAAERLNVLVATCQTCGARAEL
jgi:hypothetical protein